jgi:protein TonB
VTGPTAGEDGLQRQWVPAVWASACFHMILVGALQPASAPTDSRFSERAIEVTVERAAPPPAPPTAKADLVDSALAPGSSDAERPMQAQPVKTETPTLPLPDLAQRLKLEQAVMFPQPAPAIDLRDFALAASAAAPPQQKAIKPPASTPSASANQQQALQDYVLQVVRKLSHTRFYAASSSAQIGHGVVIARLTIARDGSLVDLSLPKQSGSAGVDGSVLDAIRKAAPFAPLPKGFADNRFTFIVPINYTPER